MIPICRDAGSVIAFGGRATEAGQQPKYLNSPETPIYSKSRTLYGLNYAKAAIRKLNYAVLVEGYFDVAQLVQAGISPVVASCGTALTPQQAQLLRRFTSKVVLSFDPDAAGQGAAVRSCELLVGEGFDVNVALLPAMPVWLAGWLLMVGGALMMSVARTLVTLPKELLTTTA
jgi:DNA primase